MTEPGDVAHSQQADSGEAESVHAAVNARQPAATENQPMANVCEHYWASHVLGGFPVAVRTCMTCRAVDWDDLKRELEEAFGKGSVVRAKRAKSMLRYIKDNLADLPGWQEAWFTEAMQVYGGETYEATYTAPSAYQRDMQIARDGSEDPAVGTTSIPDDTSHIEVYTDHGWIRADPVKLAADLTAMTNERDQLKRELGMLQSRVQDDTWQRQATTIAKQAKEIGILRDKVREYDAAVGFETTCLSCTRTLGRAYEETARAEKAEASVARVKAMAARWQYVPGKKGVARDILAAVGSNDTPEQP